MMDCTEFEWEPIQARMVSHGARPTLLLRDEKRKGKVVRPPRGGGGGRIRRRRGRRARTFVRRDQVVGLVPAVGADMQFRGKSKLFLELGPKTFIEHVVDRLRRCVGTVVVATMKGELTRTRKLLGDRAEVIDGGDGYREALQALLDHASAPFVLVHHVSWPLASPGLMRNVAEAAFDSGAASAVDYPAGSVGRLEGDRVAAMEGPRRIVVAQSPSAFRREVLMDAMHYPADDGLEESMPCELVQQAGKSISPVENDRWNIHIDSRLELEIARKVLWPALDKYMKGRGGSGGGGKPGVGKNGNKTRKGK